ncbi:hypothetical protein BD309DRAFT_951589 [Dichomitus squalens]|nr:hypothetical protein BD309DRAFT_951589 [Dichomitus squalens]
MSPSETAQFVSEYASVYIGNYCFNAAAVLFMYDSIITTGDEVRNFWGRKVTGGAVLFWLNKYMTLLYMVWDLGSNLNKSVESCIIDSRGVAAIEFLLFTVAAAFAGIRVYALQKSWPLSCITFLLSMVPVGINFTDFAFGETGGYDPPFGCIPMNNLPPNVVQKFTIASRSCLIAADFLVIGSTWFALSRRNNIGQGVVPKGTISSVLLVDGTIYFIFLAILNSLHLTFTMLSLDVAYLQRTSDFGQFTTPVTALLISRFLLHLQEASLRAVGMASSQALTTSDTGSVIFERVVGSLGASIAPDEYPWQGDDVDDELMGE